MEQKQKFQTEELISLLRHCGNAASCAECPLRDENVERCNDMNLQAADALETMYKVLKNFESDYVGG